MWRIITDNWPIKLMALVLAALVWLYANSVVIEHREILVYFEVRNPPTVDVTVVPENRRVLLTVTGPAGLIQELSRRNIQVEYEIGDVAELRADRVDKIRFDESMVQNLPPQVQVTRFRPASFEVIVRPLATMVFPVNPPKVLGKPAPGYQVGRTEIRGRTRVTVTGPVEVLNSIQKQIGAVDPEPVDVSNRSESVIDRFRRIQTTVRLDNNTRTERIHCDDVVEIYVEIKRADATVVVKEVPISVLAAPDFPHEVEITSSNPVDLSIEGPAELIKTVTAEQLHAFIDVRKRKAEDELPFFEKLIVHGLPDGARLSKEIVVTAKFKPPPGKSATGTTVP